MNKLKKQTNIKYDILKKLNEIVLKFYFIIYSKSKYPKE
jgi:hypothetical protein